MPVRKENSWADHRKSWMSPQSQCCAAKERPGVRFRIAWELALGRCIGRQKCVPKPRKEIQECGECVLIFSISQSAICGITIG